MKKSVPVITFSCSLRAVLLLLLLELQTPGRTLAMDASEALQTTSSGSTHPGTPAPFPDQELLQFLKKLYQGAKALGRPLQNGEMNLLPENSGGFANSVSCFADIGSPSVLDDSRTLRFNLSTLSTSQHIVAVDLVTKPVPDIPAYNLRLYEVIESGSTGAGQEGEGQGEELKLIHEGAQSGMGWDTIHVSNVVDSVAEGGRWRNYELVLSIDVEGGVSTSQILHQIKPMLLIYTFSDVSDSTLEETVLSSASSSSVAGAGAKGGQSPGTAMPTAGKDAPTRPHPATSFPGTVRPKSLRENKLQRRRRRRNISSVTAGGGPASNTQLPTLASLGQQHCQKEVRTMTFQQLGWPGSDFVVLEPAMAEFSFCYGLCNKAEMHQYRQQYSNHAYLLSRASPELVANGIAPGCAPTGYVPVDVKFVSKYSQVITMTTLPGVTSCSCL